MSEQRFEDVLDECINRMLGGESWQQVIAAYPQHAAALMPALQGADAMARAQYSAPPAASRAAARQRMLNEVAGTGSAAASAVKGGVVMGWMSWFRMRPPAARMAAVGAAAVMFGALTMGAAAATGNAPQPVRTFFGVSDSVISVEFAGTVTAIGGDTLTVDANGDLRTVIVDAGTEVSRGGETVGLEDVAVGDVVEVKGRLQADNTVVATRVHLEDGAVATQTPEDEGTTMPRVTEVPGGNPTALATQDGDDDDDCDNSGPGSPCDDDEHECDNSGSESPCDDDDDDQATPNAQPTADDGDDDDRAEDNSGPGSSDDGADDDNTGSGDGEDADAGDDSSGHGSGDDEAADDDSSGQGGGD